jgi:hypothetical protein
MALSDASIRAAKPKAAAYKLFDEGGLFLLVKPSGGKLWRLKFRHLGKEQLLSFGAFPDVGLKDARKRRDLARQQLAEGLNPSVEKAQSRHRGFDQRRQHPQGGRRRIHRQTRAGGIEGDHHGQGALAVGPAGTRDRTAAHR